MASLKIPVPSEIQGTKMALARIPAHVLDDAGGK
jgi:hypothetical protein